MDIGMLIVYKTLAQPQTDYWMNMCDMYKDTT